MDFVWGTRDGKQSRPWVPAEMAALLIQKGGLAVPCIRTKRLTTAVTAAGQWAATVFARVLLVGDVIWGSSGSGLVYITPCWTENIYPSLRSSLWLTGSKSVGLSSARHACQDVVMEFCRRVIVV